MTIRLPKTLKQGIERLAAVIELTAHGVNRAAAPYPELKDFLYAALELLHSDPRATPEELKGYVMTGGPKPVAVEKWQPRITPTLMRHLESHGELTSCLPERGRNQVLIRFAFARLIERYKDGQVIVEAEILRRQGARQEMPDGRRITASMMSKEAYAREGDLTEKDLELLRCDARRVQFARKVRVRGCRFTPELAELIGETCVVTSRDTRARDGQDRLVSVTFESAALDDDGDMRVNAFDLESI